MSKQSMEVKREVYVFSFALLGLLMGTVIYGLGSLLVIYKGYFLDFNWYLLILLIGGTVAGFMEGLRWWHIIYIEKSYLKWPKHRHETKLLGLVILIVLSIAVVFLARNY
jgi:hypothetical protein